VIINTILQAFLNDRITFTECLEILAVIRERKRVARLTGDRARLADLNDLARDLGWPGAAAPFHLERTFANRLGDAFCRLVSGPPPPGRDGVFFIGRPDAITAAVEMEARGCPAEEAARLYGYPPCYARKYETKIQHGEFWVKSFLDGLGGIVRAPWIMNRFGRFFAPYLSILPDYFPCHLRCDASLALGQAYLDILREAGLDAWGELAKSHLARPMLHYDGGLYLVRPETESEPTPDGQPLRVEVLSVWAYAGCPLPAPELAIRLTAAGLAVSPAGAAASGAASPTASYIMFL
jgi:hypothetical protein